jgi:hypothetical protein
MPDVISLDQLAPVGHARRVDRADLDDIEFRRVLGAPFANGRKLRDAVEVIVNGARLSELLDGAPVDVVEVRDGVGAAWLTGGRGVLVSRCGCGGTSLCGRKARLDGRFALTLRKWRGRFK